MKKLPLHPETNAINNWDSDFSSHEEKQTLIKVLKESEDITSQKKEKSAEEISAYKQERNIQAAIERNTYENKYNNEDEIREIFSKINYRKEYLWIGWRLKHSINDITFAFPDYDEFQFKDMKNDQWDYTMDSITMTDKYKIFQSIIRMNLLNPNKIYDILWEIAKAMDIKTPIDYNFFKDNSKESQKLLQMFRNITDSTGNIPINIKNNWYIEYLYCRVNVCWFDGHFKRDDDHLTWIDDDVVCFVVG